MRIDVQSSSVDDRMGAYGIAKDQFSDVITRIASIFSSDTKEFRFTLCFRENLLWQKSESWQGKVIVPHLVCLDVSCKYSVI